MTVAGSLGSCLGTSGALPSDDQPPLLRRNICCALAGPWASWILAWSPSSETVRPPWACFLSSASRNLRFTSSAEDAATGWSGWSLSVLSISLVMRALLGRLASNVGIERHVQCPRSLPRSCFAELLRCLEFHSRMRDGYPV